MSKKVAYIPQIKLLNKVVFSMGGIDYTLTIGNAFTNIEIRDNSNNVFYIEPYSLNDFIKSLESVGFKLLNSKLNILLNFENKDQKNIYESQNLSINSDRGELVDLDENKIKELKNISSLDIYLQVLGITKKINSDMNIELKSLYQNKTNDYSIYEKLINILISNEINTKDFGQENIVEFPLSTAIVIPTLNSEKELIRLLHSIDNQTLYREYFKKLNIIIIDDNSRTSINLNEKFKNIENIKIIRNNTSSFSGQARNEAYVNINQDIIITLDSDLILESNFLVNHIALNHLYENFITMSCRENVDEDKKFDTENIKNSLKSLKPDYKKDTRFKKTYPADELGGPGYEFTIKPFEQTKFFREFGNNKELEMGISLPIMLKSHNFTCSAALIRKSGFFSTFFEGWGDEDCFFGKKAMSVGAFLVPTIATSVFHVNHLPRLYASEQDKLNNLKRNVEIRNKRTKDNIYNHIT